MFYLDIDFPTPQHHLACDEALLELCEKGHSDEIIRFWESRRYFVVLGVSGRHDQEVFTDQVNLYDVPVLRRTSGGGTVLQGPGCLNYSLILKINGKHPARTIREANHTVLTHLQHAISKPLGAEVTQKGDTDLTLGELKFSGNAQRRGKSFILFHGTLLLNFNLRLIELILRQPEKQPDYRTNRPHLKFVTNIALKAETVCNALKEQWDAQTPFFGLPLQTIDDLVQSKYTTDDWNLRF